MQNIYKKLPKMDEIIERFKDHPKNLLKYISTNILEDYREKIKSGFVDFEMEDVFSSIEKNLNNEEYFSLRRAINASGVIIHTNLGRSIVPQFALDRIGQVSKGYMNLEYNIEKGERGSRYDHLRKIVCELTGAEDALLVNNNAAAVFLMLNTFCQGSEVVVSRGELVEIGESFRINEIMGRSGAILKEVGSTNRTHLYDYENAVTENTKALMKVHPSDYKVVGFTKEVTASELKGLAKENDLLILEDLGSGSLINMSKFGLSDERTVKDSIREGVDLVSFSCDKLLGSVQGGIIVGRRDLIAKIRKNQLLRAFRVGKLTIMALEATMIKFLDEDVAIREIPTLRMIAKTKEDILKSAEELKKVSEAALPNFEIEIEECNSKVGGGTYPVDTLPSYAVSFKTDDIMKFESYLRLSRHHIIATVRDNKLYMDLRCIQDDEISMIEEILKEYKN